MRVQIKPGEPRTICWDCGETISLVRIHECEDEDHGDEEEPGAEGY